MQNPKPGPHSHEPNLRSSGTGQWALSTCCLALRRSHPEMTTWLLRLSLAVIGRNRLQRIWQIESHQQPKLGLCRQLRGSGPPPHMVKRGRKRSNSNPDGKVGPWGSFTSSPCSQDVGKGISPLAAKVSSGRGWSRFIKIS